MSTGQAVRKLAIPNASDLIFGRCPKPVTCGNGLTIGGGLVYPEVNFTLPPMTISDATWSDVRRHYEEIVRTVTRRAISLSVPGLVLEFEQLPPMTANPQWGAEITEILSKGLDELHEKSGMPTALRVTVVDLRDAVRPPVLRGGKEWDLMHEAFVVAAQAGADILSIESVGGKELHDEALMMGDLQGVVVALGVLASRDMAWLWDNIVEISTQNNVVPGGDTACGFANTAMQLAGQGMIPSIFAAVDRAASAPRSLVAFDRGAVGPSKDCAYEGPVMKAITGCPISMEGKSACCAHFSPLGNIAAAAADLWSNESVQNVRLLSGSAPEAFMELLAYDCRLFNAALANDEDALRLQDCMVRSDVPLSVEALMLAPDVTIRLAEAITTTDDSYLQTVRAVRTACDVIGESVEAGVVQLAERERGWLTRLKEAAATLPETEADAVEMASPTYGSLFRLDAYGLAETVAG